MNSTSIEYGNTRCASGVVAGNNGAAVGLYFLSNFIIAYMEMLVNIFLKKESKI